MGLWYLRDSEAPGCCLSIAPAVAALRGTGTGSDLLSGCLGRVSWASLLAHTCVQVCAVFVPDRLLGFAEPYSSA